MSDTDGIHPNLKKLSHSSKVLLHKCPRKYQLYKLASPEVKDDDGDFHTDFGHAVGYGVQKFLECGNLNDTFFEMFLRWKGDIMDDEGEKKKKTFWYAMIAVEKFAEQIEELLEGYELYWYGEDPILPATELGFSIDLGNGFADRGRLDAALRHRVTGKFATLEVKTTATGNVNEAVYRNSNQGIGYSLVLDALASSIDLPQDQTFDVMYLVYTSANMEWIQFKFPYTHTRRAIWLADTLTDVQHIAEYAERGHFPARGESCFDYFKQCKWFGVCDLSDDVLIGKNPKVILDKPDDYPLVFTVDDIINSQIARHEVSKGEADENQ